MAEQIVARPEHEVRVMQEKHDLDVRIDKLQQFMRTLGYSVLTMQHKQLLARQLNAMVAYTDILAERINLFDKERHHG